MQEFEKTFKFNSPINIDNGYVNTNISKDAESEIRVWVDKDGIGGFDWEVEELDQYTSGGLWFDRTKVLTDYDGVFELPQQLIDFMRENGFNMDWADNSEPELVIEDKPIVDVVKEAKETGYNIHVFNTKTEAMVYALKFAKYGKEDYKRLIGELLDKGILKHENNLIVIDELKLLG